MFSFLPFFWKYSSLYWLKSWKAISHRRFLTRARQQVAVDWWSFSSWVPGRLPHIITASMLCNTNQDKKILCNTNQDHQLKIENHNHNAQCGERSRNHQNTFVQGLNYSLPEIRVLNDRGGGSNLKFAGKKRTSLTYLLTILQMLVVRLVFRGCTEGLAGWTFLLIQGRKRDKRGGFRFLLPTSRQEPTCQKRKKKKRKSSSQPK